MNGDRGAGPNRARTTESSTPFRTRPARGTALALGVLVTPAVVASAAGLAANGADRTSVAGVLTVVSALIITGIALTRTAAFVTATPERVVLGFAPFWRTSLRREEIASVTLVQIDAFAEYGGWGIKGRARQPRGRLYSAGGRDAIRVRTHDGRVFVVALARADQAERAAAAVRGVRRPGDIP